MDGIYFFNGKDITMNMCIQIRDVIDIIQEKSHLSWQSLPNILQTVIMKSRKQKNYKIQFDTNDNRAALYGRLFSY